jgi:two-component system response regulator NreC
VGQASPGTRVIVLVTTDDARFVRHALHAGAASCILDDLPGDDLIEAVRRAATQTLASAQSELGPPPDDLTEREFDVLRLLALGHTNPEIAAQLHLSVRTVEAHRAHLQQKLRRPSRAELVRYALDRRLLHGSEDPARD